MIYIWRLYQYQELYKGGWISYTPLLIAASGALAANRLLNIFKALRALGNGHNFVYRTLKMFESTIKEQNCQIPDRTRPVKTLEEIKEKKKPIDPKTLLVIRNAKHPFQKMYDSAPRTGSALNIKLGWNPKAILNRHLEILFIDKKIFLSQESFNEHFVHDRPSRQASNSRRGFHVCNDEEGRELRWHNRMAKSINRTS